MKQFKFLRSTALAMALALGAALLPVGSMAAQTDLVELKATDVTLDETRFPCTGQEIRPNVTVRVQDQLLTLDRDYTLTFRDNVEVGTAAVVVTGLETGGYTGTVEHPFYIEPAETEETDPELILINGTDVRIDGTEFKATGQPIEPAITVTVDGKTLTAGEEYTLAYENNVEPGTASVTVTGNPEKGYTGTVTIHYTITAAPEETQPEQTPPEETKPEETEPEQTQPEGTGPEEIPPEPVVYQITSGSGASWHKDSGKTHAFTTDGDREQFENLIINGKKVGSQYYSVTGDKATVTLKEAFLQRLETGKYNVSIVFADGEAEGTFTVSPPADDSNPKTGDVFASHLWTAALFISLTGIAGTAYAWRKKLLG